jgi:hypothetical protein
MSDRLNVLFIAGWGRSGSTLLGENLASPLGALFVGEMIYAWSDGYGENRIVGSGHRFRDDPLWSAVVSDVNAPSADISCSAEFVGKHTNLAWLGRNLALTDASASLERHRVNILQHLSAASDHSGARVIIDSSKHPAALAVLAGIPDVRLCVVHLVRHPAAVYYSWRYRRKPMNDGTSGKMASHGLLAGSLRWSLWNWAIERTASAFGIPLLSVRLEDLTASPDNTLDRIVAFADTSLQLPGDRSRRPLHSPSPSVRGNPGKREGGANRVRNDVFDQTLLSPLERFVVRFICRSGMARYGYLDNRGADPGSARPNR